MLPDLDSAINAYLDAYNEYQKFLKANETLYRVFASSWGGSPRHCAGAFATFTDSLCKDWTHKHLEVTEVFPRRNRKDEWHVHTHHGSGDSATTESLYRDGATANKEVGW